MPCCLILSAGALMIKGPGDPQTSLIYEKNILMLHIQYLFIYLGFYVAFNTVQVISRWVVGRAEETSTYSWSRFCTVNCRPTASNYQLSHLRSGWEPDPDLRGGRRECYPSATLVPAYPKITTSFNPLFLRWELSLNSLQDLHYSGGNQKFM